MNKVVLWDIALLGTSRLGFFYKVCRKRLTHESRAVYINRGNVVAYKLWDDR